MEKGTWNNFYRCLCLTFFFWEFYLLDGCRGILYFSVMYCFKGLFFILWQSIVATTKFPAKNYGWSTSHQTHLFMFSYIPKLIQKQNGLWLFSFRFIYSTENTNQEKKMVFSLSYLLYTCYCFCVIFFFQF